MLVTAADSGLDGDEVEPALLETVSGLGSGSRQIGVYEQRWSAPSGPLCVALWGVGDPGNVGTILRSALAFGAALGGARPRLRGSVRAEGRARVDGRAVRDAGRARGARRRAARASGSRSWRTPASRWRPAGGRGRG